MASALGCNLADNEEVGDDGPGDARAIPRGRLAGDGIRGLHPLCGHFTCQGARLADAIGGLAARSGIDPDVDLRRDGVTVRLTVSEDGELSEQDAILAGEIAAAARELDLNVDLGGVQMIQVAIDAMSIPDVVPFWQAVLGYEVHGDSLLDPKFEGPTVWFQQMDAPRPQRNRIHVDVYLPQDQTEARIAAALAAGGRIVYDGHAPDWWTLADPEGNEVDVAHWPDRTEN
jgi:4a-hydroxytetrahydrobiopterin dehydratase